MSFTHPQVPRFPVRRNIRFGLLFVGCWMFIPIIPLFIPYLTSLDFSMQEILSLQAYFGFVVAAFEIPSGYLADYFGRARILKLGAFTSALGFSYLCVSSSFTDMIIYETLVGIGLSMASGADYSILYDSLVAGNLRNRRHFTELTARFHFIQLIAEALSAFVCSILILYSFLGFWWQPH